MTMNYSSDAFKAYLDDARNFESEGHSAIHNLKGTAARLMANVIDGEYDDVRQADADQLIERHLKTTGVSMSPHSKLTYKSRFNRAVHRFITHQDEAINSEVKSSEAASKFESDDTLRGQPEAKTSISKVDFHSEGNQNSVAKHSFNIPILIRPESGITVEISGVPLDLTNEEAERIASILKVYARP